MPKRLAILLACFLGLALFYSVIIPIFEGPDEDDHFRYAKFIADTRAFPVQLFEAGGGVAGHQGWQPPLYYSLAALVILPINTTDFQQHLWRNEAVTFVGDPACCGRNIYYHTASENMPYTGTTLAVHLARLLSILFGAVTVWATYKIAETVLRHSALPNAAWLSLAAAAFVAFNPSFLFASSLVSNDAPLAALSSLVLLAWVRLLGDSTAPGSRSQELLASAALGGLIGLAILVKTSAIGLIPLSMLLLVVVSWRRRDWRLAILGNAILLAVIAVVAGWWFVRNQLLYGDPIAYRLMLASAIFPRAGPLTVPELFNISLPWMWQTFWGGPTPGDFSLVLLMGLAAVAALTALGTVIYFLRPLPFAVRSSFLFLAAWLALIFAAQIQFIRTTTGADQGRYLFPAIAALALFFVVGLTALVDSITQGGRRLHSASRFSSPLIILALFLLAIMVPLAYTLPAYAEPALASEIDLSRAQHPLQVNFANQIELRGYDLDARSVEPGEAWHITLYWQALAPMPESNRVFVHLVGANNYVAGGADVVPARGAFPTVYWKPGDALRDRVEIPVSANAPAGKYAIEVGLYPVGRPGERLPIAGSGDDRALLDSIKIAPRQPVAYAPQTRLDADFAGKAKLIGYDSNSSLDSLSLVLYWQDLEPFDRDYSVFVHALDGSGKIIAQVDQQPQKGNYPTSIWGVGEEIRDEYALTIPADARSSVYHVELGLYRPDTDERLSVSANGVNQDHLELNLPGTAQ